MEKNKKGFTLSEVLVCIVIIGVIMAFSVNTIRIVKASYTALTYFTFKNLQSIVGTLYSGDTIYTDATLEVRGTDDLGSNKYTVTNVKLGKESLYDAKNKRIPSAVGHCKDFNSGNIITVLKNDYEYENSIGKNAQNSSYDCQYRLTSAIDDNRNGNIVFCQAFAALTNSVGTPKCGEGDMIDVNFVSDNPAFASFDTTKPNIITTNGQRYYISKWKKDSRVSDLYGFRLVAVDLNGKSRPNKIDTLTNSKKSNPPDIVEFLVLDNGEVFPMGLAADNLKLNDDRRVQYITSTVKGYYFAGDEESVASRKARDANALVKSIPDECKLKMRDLKTNEEIGGEQCNFARIQVNNPNDSESKGFFTYREAYCYTHKGEALEYKNYCNGVTSGDLCPPTANSQGFDVCRIENIKPMFRYNFR